MPTKKIKEGVGEEIRRVLGEKRWRTVDCRHPEHNPPSHMDYAEGTYEHTCPGCGGKQFVVVGAKPTLWAVSR